MPARAEAGTTQSWSPELGPASCMPKEAHDLRPKRCSERNGDEFKEASHWNAKLHGTECSVPAGRAGVIGPAQPVISGDCSAAATFLQLRRPGRQDRRGQDRAPGVSRRSWWCICICSRGRGGDGPCKWCVVGSVADRQAAPAADVQAGMQAPLRPCRQKKRNGCKCIAAAATASAWQSARSSRLDCDGYCVCERGCSPVRQLLASLSAQWPAESSSAWLCVCACACVPGSCTQLHRDWQGRSC